MSESMKSTNVQHTKLTFVTTPLLIDDDGRDKNIFIFACKIYWSYFSTLLATILCKMCLKLALCWLYYIVPWFHTTGYFSWLKKLH